jgi:hypothetical protein
MRLETVKDLHWVLYTEQILNKSFTEQRSVHRKVGRLQLPGPTRRFTVQAVHQPKTGHSHKEAVHEAMAGPQPLGLQAAPKLLR